MEAVLLTVSPSYVAEQLAMGTHTGRRHARFKDNIDRPLAAILTLNTIAHTVGAAGAGAEAMRVFGEAWLALFSAILTLLILFVSEIVPKTLGAVYWRELAPSVGATLEFTVRMLYPLVVVSQGLTRLLTPAEKRAMISRREFNALAKVGMQEGVLNERESTVVQNLLKLGSVEVCDIMTPRVVIRMLPENVSVSQALQPEILRFSRIPIHASDNPDNITGMVLKDELLLHSARGEGDRPLSELKRDLMVVPPSVSLPLLFDQFLDRAAHIALVVDEYGDVRGLVTMEDLIETLLGTEIVDEADSVEDMRQLAQRHWQRRARKLGLIEIDSE
jgi:CBS domain containing-hemolysin-like protein